MTIFNFTEVEELKEFSSFNATVSPDDKNKWEVHAFTHSNSKTSVIAKDFKSQRYASLFAELCECVNGMKG